MRREDKLLLEAKKFFISMDRYEESMVYRTLDDAVYSSENKDVIFELK